MKTEEWRPVDGWPYEVSDHGQVRRAITSGRQKSTYPGRILRGHRHKDGYRAVLLCAEGRQKHFLVHRLVAHAFLGPPPTSDHDVAHGDGSRDNNHVANLRWATARENCADTIRHGRTPRGERSSAHKLTDADVLALRDARKQSGLSYDELGRRFGVSGAHAHRLVTGSRRPWVRAEPDGMSTSPHGGATG